MNRYARRKPLEGITSNPQIIVIKLVTKSATVKLLIKYVEVDLNVLRGLIRKMSNKIPLLTVPNSPIETMMTFSRSIKSF